MKDILAVISYFNLLGPGIIKNAKSVAYELTETIYKEAKQRSPVDTGLFKSQWNIRPGPKTGRTIASYSVTNNVSYGVHLERGSLPGSDPWPRVGKRTVFVGGRIWSTQAIGGVMQPTIDSLDIAHYADLYAASILRGLR